MLDYQLHTNVKMLSWKNEVTYSLETDAFWLKTKWASDTMAMLGVLWASLSLWKFNTVTNAGVLAYTGGAGSERA